MGEIHILELSEAHLLLRKILFIKTTRISLSVYLDVSTLCPDLENGQPHTDRFPECRMPLASTDESDQPHTDFSLVAGRFPFS